MGAGTSELKRAVEFYALCPRYPAVANSQVSEGVVGQHVTLAQERGRAWDLCYTAAELLAELENGTP